MLMHTGCGTYAAIRMTSFSRMPLFFFFFFGIGHVSCCLETRIMKTKAVKGISGKTLTAETASSSSVLRFVAERADQSCMDVWKQEFCTKIL